MKPWRHYISTLALILQITPCGINQQSKLWSHAYKSLHRLIPWHPLFLQMTLQSNLIGPVTQTKFNSLFFTTTSRLISLFSTLQPPQVTLSILRFLIFNPLITQSVLTLPPMLSHFLRSQLLPSQTKSSKKFHKSLVLLLSLSYFLVSLSLLEDWLLFKISQSSKFHSFQFFSLQKYLTLSYLSNFCSFPPDTVTWVNYQAIQQQTSLLSLWWVFKVRSLSISISESFCLLCLSWLEGLEWSLQKYWSHQNKKPKTQMKRQKNQLKSNLFSTKMIKRILKPKK